MGLAFAGTTLAASMQSLGALAAKMESVKVVGRRRDRPSRLADAAALQRLVIGLRRTPFLVPRGVYRFRSFEEADRWMIETTARTYVSLTSATSSASAGR